MSKTNTDEKTTPASAGSTGSAVPLSEADQQWIDKAWEQYKQCKPTWTQTPPTHQGEYWHWNGDEDCAPLPMFVMWSGTSGKCFVSAGQLGITKAIDCEKYGGWWMMMITPKLPNSVYPTEKR